MSYQFTDGSFEASPLTLLNGGCYALNQIAISPTAFIFPSPRAVMRGLFISAREGIASRTRHQTLLDFSARFVDLHIKMPLNLDISISDGLNYSYEWGWTDNLEAATQVAWY